MDLCIGYYTFILQSNILIQVLNIQVCKVKKKLGKTIWRGSQCEKNRCSMCNSRLKTLTRFCHRMGAEGSYIREKEHAAF